uniref:Glutathione transferase n=1 Tax=Rhabditophanes sp. KR3021 TaxID=114890 RepID=A0AC35TGF3_9BILA
MAPKYTFTYFNSFGKGEVTRLAFAYAKVPYDDVRIDKEDWPAVRATNKFPFDQLPFLEVQDDKGTFCLAQSRAIEKYIGDVFGLMGVGRQDHALIDQYISGIDDFMANFKPIYLEQDESKKPALIKEFLEGPAVVFLTRYNNFVKKNGHNHIVGKKISIADIALFHILWFLEKKIDPMALEPYPELQHLYNDVLSQPNISAYIAERTDLPM